MIEMIFKKRFWFQKLTESSKLCLYSSLLLLPGITVLVLFGMTNRVWDIPTVYVVVDTIVFISSWRYAVQHFKAQEEEKRLLESGEGLLMLRKKIQELKEIEERK